MNEITGASGSSNLSDIAAQQKISRARTRPDAAATRGVERASDGVEIRAEALAISKLGDLPEVRSERVNRIALEVNNPDYDIDAKLALAFSNIF